MLLVALLGMIMVLLLLMALLLLLSAISSVLDLFPRLVAGLVMQEFTSISLQVLA